MRGGQRRWWGLGVRVGKAEAESGRRGSLAVQKTFRVWEGRAGRYLVGPAQDFWPKTESCRSPSNVKSTGLGPSVIQAPVRRSIGRPAMSVPVKHLISRVGNRKHLMDFEAERVQTGCYSRSTLSRSRSQEQDACESLLGHIGESRIALSRARRSARGFVGFSRC